jgi:cytochrome c oxidase cbb3-type subunit 1
MNAAAPISLSIRHALAWLTAANAVGVMMAALLCWPQMGSLMGELSYGRWVPIHLNWQLYGWTSMPLIGYLFFCYEVEKNGRSSQLARVAIWLWSGSLMALATSCLSGVTSGKIFLDWKGPALLLFLATQLVLWLTLAIAFLANRSLWSRSQIICRALILLGLLTVPLALWITTSPETYPPIDRSTGGPTGASLLGSTLIVVALMLALPHTFGWPARWRFTRWLMALWVAQWITFLLLEWRGGTHHEWPQILGLALLLPWMLIIPRYWSQATWPEHTRGFRIATYAWWSMLVLSGWIEFLPGILDRMKFTNGLVAHAHLAMAGFTSSYLLMMIAAMSGKEAVSTLRSGLPWWHGATFLYVIAMMLAGWWEGADYSWMSVAPLWRESLFLLRLSCGVVMFLVAWRWWRGFSLPSNQS